jgi:alpha-amylase
MHKKMIAVSAKVADAIASHPERENENEVMRTELYRAQCNCSYWHGLFGGLYLNSLRDTVYRHLLVAEAFADAQLNLAAPAWAPNRQAASADQVHVWTRDLDGDLQDEIAMQSATLDVEELAYRPKTFMLTNVLGRHEEAYHAKLRAHLAREAAGVVDDGTQPKSIHDLVKVKEPGLDKYLVYDRYRRLCFVDHFFAPGTTPAEFADGTARELGDFVGARYEFKREREESVWLDRVGTVDGRRVAVRKRVRVHVLGGDHPSRLEVTYGISLVEGAPIEVWFAPELSLTLLDGHSQERVYQVPDRELPPDERVLASRGALEDVPAIALVNQVNRFAVTLRFGDARPTVWRFPLETVSMSEAGFERTYQGSVLAPIFRLSLGPSEESRSAGVQLSVDFADL